MNLLTPEQKQFIEQIKSASPSGKFSLDGICAIRKVSSVSVREMIGRINARHPGTFTKAMYKGQPMEGIFQLRVK